MHIGFCGKSRRKETWGNVDVGKRLILKWILEKHDGMAWKGSVAGSCVYCNELMVAAGVYPRMTQLRGVC
jgi:hypothetical protein